MVRRIGLLVIGSVVLGMPSAHAAVITVTTTADGGPGSLRAAFGTANTNGQDDEIVLQAGAEYQLTLCGGVGEEDANADGDLDHTAAQALTITGNGATIRNTCPDERIIEMVGGSVVMLFDVTLTGGLSNGDGGAISVGDTDIFITESRLQGNLAAADEGAIESTNGDIRIFSSSLTGNTALVDYGVLHTTTGAIVLFGSIVSGNRATDHGAIHTTGGPITILRSTLSLNVATEDSSGAVGSTGGPVTITNSTLSGNSIGDSGGGAVGTTSSDISVLGSTFVGNSAAIGADAIRDNSGTVSVANSIFSDSGPAPECGGGGTFTSAGHNLGADASCGLTATGDRVGLDPVLGPLVDNGGPAPTHALLKGSLAIDAGNPAAPGSGGNACEATDQRGLPRTACDIGAYELVLCAKVPVNRIGTPGKDTLTGTPGPDGLLGLQGNDRLAGKAGRDGLCGGPGKDTLKGGGAKDRLDGGPGKDLCVGQAGRDKAKGCERKKRIP